MYSGESICNSSRAGKLVFVDRDSRYSQKEIAGQLKSIDTAAKAGGIFDGISLECKEALVATICYIYLPDCMVVSNHSVERFSICREDCFATINGSPSCTRNADGAAYGRIIFTAIQLQPSVLGDFQPDCSQFPTVKESNGSCVNVGLADIPLPTTTPTPTPTSTPSSQAATIQSQPSFLPNNCSLDNCSEKTDSPFPIVIVASGASGALVIIIILVVILIICTYRRRRKSRNETYDTQTARSSRPNAYQGFPLVPLRPSLWDSETEQKIRKVAIDPDRLQIQDIIGEGSFGKVYKCLLDSSQMVAAKSVKIDPSSDPTKETQSFVMEALRMTDLNHPNVMNLLGKQPFYGKTNEQVVKAVVNGDTLTEPDELRLESLYNIMKTCWRSDPNDRPTFAHLLTTLQEL
ncbi:uncharacterized protein [Oscarella lobularis]|uniref:uncharacterized protein n=1 Tax=Oscarella lobularis TaxID=121494 RepID=UPI003313DF72